MYRTRCDAVDFPHGNSIVIRTKEKHASQLGLETANRDIPADLLIGCDGINSIVRTSLEGFKGKVGGEMMMKDFGLTCLPSAAAGLRYKMLSLQPKFVLKKSQIPLRSVPEKG